MSEEINGRKIFSLLEVTQSIQKTIADRYKSSYWIKAEMNKLNYFSTSGHCYPDLVEKQDGKVIAEMKCNIWKDDFIKINSTFQRVLNEPLKDGIKILFLATINFHPEHGLKLRILDIDPVFTLGDLAREKQEAIIKLQSEGIFKKNKSLTLPLLPQRIAIISVHTSKGYLDFLGKIDNNTFGYKFFHMLFPAILQGDKATEQITRQLNKINKVKSHFDAVAIIRGGGGDVGLSAYNNYEFAKAIALFPLPVLSGIGHITNETVVEMVSHKSFITPTDLANFLFQEFHNFSVPVQSAKETISAKSARLLIDEKLKFQSEVKLFRLATGNIISKNRNDLKENIQSLSRQSLFVFKNQKEYLASTREEIKKSVISFCNFAKQDITQFVLLIKKDITTRFKQINNEIINIEKNVSNMSPKNVLKRGYSITLMNGKAVKTSGRLKEGETINTILFEGSLLSTVKSTTKPDEG